LANSGVVSKIFGSKSRHKLSVEWSASQDISGNKSTITAKMYWESLSGYGSIYSSTTKSGSIYIDEVWYDFSGAGLAALSGVQKKHIATKTRTISHNAAGELDVTIDGWFAPEVDYAGEWFGTFSLPGQTWSVNDIPRKSTLTDTTPSFTAGSDFNIGVKYASSSFTHKAYIDVLDYNGTWQYIKAVDFGKGETSKSSNFDQRDKNEIFQRLGGRSSATFRINLHTYNGSTSLGHNTYTGTVSIPSLTTVKSVNGQAYRSNDVYVDQSITIDLDRSDGEFNHTLVISGGGFSKTIPDIWDSATFTFSPDEQEDLYNAIGPNSFNMDGNIRIYTYYLDTQVGSYKDYDLNFYVKSSVSSPSFSGSGVSYMDTNIGTTGMTGTTQTLVQNRSYLRVAIPTSARATAKNGANMEKYTVTIGGKSVSADYSSSSTVYVYFGEVDSATDVVATVKAEDSRGFSTSATLPISMVAYSNPVLSTTPKRRNGFEDLVEISVSGSFSPVSLSGSVKNDLRPISGYSSAVQYRYRENVSGSSFSSWADIPVSKSGVTYSGKATSVNTDGETVQGVELDNTKAYLFEIRVSDKLGTTILTKSVASGKPIFFIDSVRKSVGINKFPELSNTFEVEGRGHFKQSAWSRVTIESTEQGTDPELMLTAPGGEWSIRNDDSENNILDFRWNNDSLMSLRRNGVLDQARFVAERVPAGANLNDYQDPGFYYSPMNVDAQQISNTPTNSAFSLLVEKHAGVRQTFTTYNPDGWTSWARNEYSGTWGKWYKIANTMGTLWTGGYMMVGSQTVYPTKRLDECATGWILAFSQYSSGSIDAEWNYTVVPKTISSGMLTHNIIGTAGWSIDTKYLRIYHDRISGHDGNDDTGRGNAVLRYVFEF
jgi:hypothetical protein